MKITLYALLSILIAGILFRILCGIFVIQPIGILPKGATIIYMRIGLDLPFISSADGILEKSEAGVSLIGRGLLIGKLAKPIQEKELFRFSYSEILYLWSTDGKKYDK